MTLETYLHTLIFGTAIFMVVFTGNPEYLHLLWANLLVSAKELL